MNAHYGLKVDCTNCGKFIGTLETLFDETQIIEVFCNVDCKHTHWKKTESSSYDEIHSLLT